MGTIPNDQMAQTDIENIARRPHIRRAADIHLPLDTPPRTAERAVEIVRKILDDHEGMHEDFPPRVYFNEFNRDSLNIRFMYWFRPPEYWDFMAFSEKVNLRIKTEFEAEGIRFALPALKVVGDGKVPPTPA